MIPKNPPNCLASTEAKLEVLLKLQHEILDLLKSQVARGEKEAVDAGYLTAKDFMDSVHIRRTKFDQLVAENRIRIVKKKRKIYVPATEVGRYFTDPSIL